MQRILGRVVDLKDISQEGTIDGFPVRKVLLKVRVEDKGAKGFKLPPRTKGRVHWVRRECTGPWGIEKGDRIILDFEEVKSLLSPLRLEPTIVAPEKGRVGLLLSFHNPLATEGLRWRVDLGNLGAEREGIFGRGDLSRLRLKVRVGEEGAHPIVAECGGFQARAVVPVVRPGSTLSYSLDVNSDGFEEVVLENEYLRAVIVPHLGGRLGSLLYKGTGRDKFSSILEYGKGEHIEYGGSHEGLGREPPGELWDAQFKTVDVGDSWVLLTYKSKGLEVEKRVEVLPSMAALHQKVTFSWRGKGEKEVLYWHRISLAVGERPWTNTLLIPTREKLERLRHYPPYGWHGLSHHFGLRFGGLLFHREEGEESLLCLTDPETIECAEVSFTRRALVGLVRRKPVKLKTGDSVSHSSLYILGEGYSIDEGNLAMISRGEGRKGRCPISLNLRPTESPNKVSARIGTEKGERAVKVTERGLDGVGKVYVGMGSVTASAGISATVTADGSRHSIGSAGRSNV